MGTLHLIGRAVDTIVFGSIYLVKEYWMYVPVLATGYLIYLNT